MVDSIVPQTEVPQLFRGNRWDTALTSAAIGVVGGIAIGFAFASNNLAKSFTLAATAAGAGGAIAYFVTDDRATSRRNELQAKLNQLIDERQAQQREFNRLTTDRQSLHQQTVQLEQRLKHQAEQGAIDLAGAKSSLDTLTQRLKNALQAQSEATEKMVERETQITALQAEIGQLQRDRLELSDRIEDMIEATELEVQQRVEQQTAVRLKVLRETEIKQVCQEYDGLADRLFATFERLERWGAKVKESHDSKSQIISGLASDYNENLGRFYSRTKTEAEEHIKQIELLRERLARAQSQNRGEILEPGYLNAEFSPPKKAANAMLRSLFDHHGIALEALGWEDFSDGSHGVGLKLSRSADPLKVCALVNEPVLESLRRSTQVFRIDALKYQAATNTLLLRFWISRPNKASLDRPSCLRPISEFSKLVLKVMKHPSLRFMGVSGSGKSSVVRLLLSAVLQSEQYAIALHDPQDRSAENEGEPIISTGEDRWELPKASKSIEESKKALSVLSKRVESRIAAPFKTIHVFDELDSILASNKEAFSKVIKMIRHQKPTEKAVFIGQNPGARGVGLEWGDMANMVCFYVGTSAINAIEKNPELKARKESLTKQYTAIVDYAQELNDQEGLEKDEPSFHRFALVCIPEDKPFWVELPPFSDGIDHLENLITEEVDYLSATTSVRRNTGTARAATQQQDAVDNAASAATGAFNPDSVVAVSLAAAPYVGVGCIRCNEGTYTKTKSSRGVKYYTCNKCSKSTSENVLNQAKG